MSLYIGNILNLGVSTNPSLCCTMYMDVQLWFALHMLCKSKKGLVTHVVLNRQMCLANLDHSEELWG